MSAHAVLRYFKLFTIMRIKFIVLLFITLICPDTLVFGQNNSEVRVKLSEQERSYLREKGSIKMCVDPNWMPFDHIDNKGRHEGILADYLKLVADRLDISFQLVATNTYTESKNKLKEGACSIISGDVFSKENSEDFLATEVYFTNPRAFAVHTDRAFVYNFDDISDSRIGVEMSSAATEIIPALYPRVDLVPIEGIRSGLQKVASKEIDAFVTSLGGLVYSIRKQALSNVKIGGVIESDVELSVLVNKQAPLLVSILNKALETINVHEKRAISEYWIPVNYEKGVDYTLIWQLIIGSILVLTIIVYRNYKLRMFNEMLTNAQLETNELNQKLNRAYRELSQQNDDLEKLSYTDKLTGLKNRRKLDEIFELEINRTARYKTDFSVILIDIDHFKKVNDNYGHLSGDDVLKRIASIIQMNIRNTDTGGRWGGEEFIVMCPAVGLNGAASLAEKLRIEIERHDFPNGIEVTASFGVSASQEGDDVVDIIRRADNAVYKAKDDGRNRVVAS